MLEPHELTDTERYTYYYGYIPVLKQPIPQIPRLTIRHKSKNFDTKPIFEIGFSNILTTPFIV